MTVVRTFRALVVDDECPARRNACRLLATDTRFEMIGEAATGTEALERIESSRPDLVLLDVRMPGMSGFDVLDAVGPDRDFVVVFSTAFDQHALRAFDAHAVDYLLKPYDAERFRRAVDKAWRLLTAGTRQSLEPAADELRSADRLVVRTGLSWVALDIAQITRLRASDKHVEVWAEGTRHVVRQSLQTILERVGHQRFARIHRSDAVNVAAVAKLEPLTHGDALLSLRDGSSVVLSRTYRDGFLERWAGRLAGES